MYRRAVGHGGAVYTGAATASPDRGGPARIQLQRDAGADGSPWLLRSVQTATQRIEQTKFGMLPDGFGNIRALKAGNPIAQTFGNGNGICCFGDVHIKPPVNSRVSDLGRFP